MWLRGSQGMLIAARAVQGVGGAIVSAVALSLMMTLFIDPAERAKAMGIFGFVASGGGSLGVLLGGILTDALDWHWIFLVNVPVGALVIVLTAAVISGACRDSRRAARPGRSDDRDGFAHDGGVRDRQRERGRLADGPDTRTPRSVRCFARDLRRHRGACLHRSCRSAFSVVAMSPSRMS